MAIELPNDFLEFLKLLSDHNVEYLLIGGYAVGYHGYPRATGDMDIWIACEQATADQMVKVYRSFGLAQGIEFLRPLKSSRALEEAHGLLRRVCTSISTDRYMAPEIERATLLVRNGALSKVFRALPGSDNLPALWIPV